MPRSQISPKAHGAWLGAGTGQAIADVIVNIFQTYVTHAPLSSAATQGIYIVISAGLALVGAYILPPAASQTMATVTSASQGILPVATYSSTGGSAVTLGAPSGV